MAPERLRAIAFDFDGTLVHLTIDFARMRRDVIGVLASYGVDDPSVLSLYVLEMVDAAAAQLVAWGRDPAPMRAEAHAALEAVECEAARYARPIPGVRGMLENLRQKGYGLAVVTRNSGMSARTAFEGVESLVDAFLPREAVSHVKPHPEHLGRCLDLLGVRPGEALMVGDHPMDVRSGKAHGMMTAGVLTGNSSREDLASAEPDWILDDVTGLLRVLSEP